MEVYLEPITASQAHHSFSDFAQALGTADVTTTTVKGGFAYATIGGVGAFLEAVGGSPGWDDVTKQFLIGTPSQSRLRCKAYAHWTIPL